MKKVKEYIDYNNPINSTKPLSEQIKFLEEEFFISKKASVEILEYCNLHNVNAFVAMNELGLKMCITSKFEELQQVYEILKEVHEILKDFSVQGIQEAQEVQEIKENYSKYFSIVMKKTRGSMSPNSLKTIFDMIFDLEN